MPDDKNQLSFAGIIDRMDDKQLRELHQLVTEKMQSRGLQSFPREEKPAQRPVQRPYDGLGSSPGVRLHNRAAFASVPIQRPQPAQQPVQSGPTHIWVDGSYDKKSKGYSYGMVVEHQGGDDELFARKFPEDAASSMNNVAGELAGATAALHYAKDHGLKEVVIHHDYTGIGEWADGRWKAKNPHTQAYKSLVESMRQTGLNVTFSHVSGHTGVAQNEKCDELAKHALGIELSTDPAVQAATGYQSASDKSQTIQSAIAKAAQDYNFDGQMQL